MATTHRRAPLSDEAFGLRVCTLPEGSVRPRNYPTAGRRNKEPSARRTRGRHPPALLWVLVTLVVEVQGDLRIQADAKVIVHDALLCVILSAKGGFRPLRTTPHTSL